MMAAAADVVIERLLDRAVARAMTDSPRATQLIQRLQGRRLAITVSGTPWTTVIESTGRSLKALRTDAPADFAQQMLGAIVGIEIPITTLTGKWKVSQNRTAADRAAVAAALDARGAGGDSNAAAMAELVRRSSDP